MNYQEIIERIYCDVTHGENPGEVATYIPELAHANPEKFGVFFSSIHNETFGIGQYDDRFSIQSIVKVFSLCMAYKLKGEAIWTRLGYEPSGTAFNSLVQLETDKGIPKNPLINAGAIVISDILMSTLQNPHEDFLAFVREVSDNPRIEYSQHIADSERSAGYVNIALCNYIKHFGNIHNQTDELLNFYFNICSIELSCEELCKAFLFLANGGIKANGADRILTTSQVKRINAIMQTCGFYDESGDFAFRVGLPGKSGVGGGIIAVHPGQYCISVWSPRLNKKGNSFRGIKFLEQFTTMTELSIF